MALRYEGMNERSGPLRFLGHDMVFLPPLAKTLYAKARSTGLRASTRTTIYPPANLCRRGFTLSCNAKVHRAAPFLLVTCPNDAGSVSYSSSWRCKVSDCREVQGTAVLRASKMLVGSLCQG